MPLQELAMPDWKQLVRKRTRAMTLPPTAKEQVIAELSDHLEEVYESARRQGLSERTSLMLALQEIGDWTALTADIERTKSEDDPMNRSKTLLIPTFVNLILSSALINVCDWFGLLDLRVVRSGQMPPVFQPWLFVLPICGATAALLARRADASPSTRLTAALSPCIVWLATLFVLKLIFICFPGFFVGVPLGTLAFAAVGWFLLPALALFIGAVPFLGIPINKRAYE
jgi:hypothetical protein